MEYSMRIDNLIQALLPHDEKFFVLFDKLSKTIVEGADTLRTLPSLPSGERESVVKKIQEIEHKADSITHEIFTELNRTFVTPLDREDIHTLASVMDDVMDLIDGSANRFYLYKIKKNSSAIQKLTDVIYQCAVELQKGVLLITDSRRNEELQKILHSVNQFENDADDIFNQAIADLFEKESDAIELIKTKEVLVTLETATDKCEDVANVLESIMIKNA